MAFKFPFTNYHELNLTWVLEQLKKLFEESEENVETIETYDNRLSAVETEVSTLETTTSQAINTANAAATNAATALSRANTANQNALTASSQAGAAVTAAQESQQEAQAATQAAQQAQATAMTFDGRITQAENDASSAVHAAESFENRVNAAINTANNAANTATIAQGIAVNANQTAAQGLDIAQTVNGKADQNAEHVGNLSDLITTVKNNLVSAINEVVQTTGEDETKAPIIIANASGDIASFKDGADDMEIRHLLATINPIQAGTGNPSPSNIRPISGVTELAGQSCGKNLWSFAATYNPTGYEVLIDRSPFLLYPGTYTFSAIPNIAGANIVLFGYHEDGSRTEIARLDASTTIVNNTIVLTKKVVSLFFVSNSAGTISNIQLETGSTATEYHPYQSQIISVSWATEAGTVYGGTLDIITGELTVTWINRTLNGSDGSTYRNNGHSSISTRAYVTIPQKANGLDNMISDKFSALGQSGDGVYVMYGRPNSNGIEFFIPPDVPNNTADIITWFTNNPAQLVYELATPQTYQLDPATVKTLLGYNNIFTDCGPVSVDYPADTKLYIDGKFAELQALVLEN